TLSAIEQRLFPDSPPQTSLAPAAVDDVLREIDLDALGAAAMPVPEFDVNFEEENTGVPLIPPSAPAPPAVEVEETPAPVPPVAEPAPLAPQPALAPVPPPEPLPERGDLLEQDLPRLLHRIHRDGFTGRLRLHRGSVEKSLYFEQGQPVYATSSLPQD